MGQPEASKLLPLLGQDQCSIENLHINYTRNEFNSTDLKRQITKENSLFFFLS
jgi:hypothetical protein